jgi:hypothetical protein
MCLVDPVRVAMPKSVATSAMSSFVAERLHLGCLDVTFFKEVGMDKAANASSAELFSQGMTRP